MNRGIGYGVMAYVLWGLLPIFWKSLATVPALEILSHRVVWSLLLCAVLLFARRQTDWIREAIGNPRTLLVCGASTLLLSLNWGLYIWAVNSGHIVEASLGYFINPLVSVALGVVVLGESMRRVQWFAIGIATAGVLFLAVVSGHPPWISLVLAVSFGFYGLLKKRATLAALEGLTVETVMVALPALGYILWLGVSGEGGFTPARPVDALLLVSAGVATATPLLFFSAAAQRIPLSLLGLLQYIAPTLQFLLGVFVYGEAFGTKQLIGFAIIWLALVLFAADAIAANRRRPG